MKTTLAMLSAALLLAGCYNPRYPSETPGDRPRPNETGASGNASNDRSPPRQSVNTVTNVYRTGLGTVETVNRSPAPSSGGAPSASSAAGGTNVRNDEVSLRMDDGTRQIILLPVGSGLNAGDRIEVTSDARIVKR
jgi:hypothetical protein